MDILRKDHPRVCGYNLYNLPQKPSSKGSSPLVRVQQLTNIPTIESPRIIPACAGTTQALLCHVQARQDHPRLCGYNDNYIKNLKRSSGSSPLVRVQLYNFLLGIFVCRIIPACAGTTKWAGQVFTPDKDHPRLCGYNESIFIFMEYHIGSSPLVRVQLVVLVKEKALARIIPACAGTTVKKIHY